MLYAISGGAGFLGLHLARRLLADGHTVRTLDVAPLDDAALEGSVEELRGDIRDLAAVRRLVDGADVVVHAAAALPIQASRAQIRSVNVGGTENILVAARDAAVARALLVSSTAVYGVPEKHPIEETDPLVGVGDYGESKIDAEALFRVAAVESTIIRPKTFIGPERLGVFEILFDWIREGRRIPILGDGSNRYQLLAVEDLVDAIVRACTSAAAARETYNVGARVFGTVRSDLQALIDHAGSGARLRPVPHRPAEVVLRGLELAHLSPLAEWHYRTAYRDSFVDVTKAERAARLEPAPLERAGADRDLRLVPGQPRHPGRRRRHAPRAVEPAGARPAQEDQLMLVLTRSEVEELLDLDALVEAVAAAQSDLSAGLASMPARIAALVADQEGLLGAMPAYLPSAGLACKLVTLFPRNRDRHTHQAAIMVFDPANGSPVALMDGTYITATRTAAASALATRLLAREDASVLAVLGTGVQAQSHARALVRVRDFTDVRVAARDRAKADALAAEIGARAVDSWEEALHGADVVAATTHALEPVVRREWLSPGVHVNSVGLNQRGREVDEATVEEALLVVESRASALAPPPAGAPELAGLAPERVHAELGELVRGERPGRTSRDEITLYKSVGVAVQDVAAAALVLEAARERRIGTEIDLGAE